MNFNTLVESYLTSIEEGRKLKSDKFSNFEIDTQKLNEMLDNGSFDVFLTAWADHAKYGNVSVEQIKDSIRKVSSEVEEYGIDTYADLKSTVERVTDSVYEDKGMGRKTLVDRLTKAIINLIFHKEYNLVNLDVVSQSRPEPEDEMTGLSEVENAVVEYIDHSEEPVTLDILNKHFSGANTIIDSLVEKKIVSVNPDGVITLVGNLSGLEDLDNDTENPLNADEDVRDTFSRTFRSSGQAEDEYGSSMGDIFNNPESMGGWNKRRYWGRHNPED